MDDWQYQPDRLLNPTPLNNFSTGLEQGIIERVKTQPEIRYNDILKEFGDYSTVHETMKNLMIKNMIYFFPAGDPSQNPIVKTPQPHLSQWDTMNAEPCFTCQHIDECNIGNASRNPVTCSDLNEWIEMELLAENENHE